MSLRLHKRTQMVASAKVHFNEVFLDWLQKNDDLTYLEVLGIVNEVQSNNLKYALRQERHPDEECDYKGDEECQSEVCRASNAGPGECECCGLPAGRCELYG